MGEAELYRKAEQSPFLAEVVSIFTSAAIKQEVKGLKRYGQTLDPLSTQGFDWLEMAKEELVDAFKYLQAERVRRDVLITAAISQIEEACQWLAECGAPSHVLVLLDKARSSIQGLLSGR